MMIMTKEENNNFYRAIGNSIQENKDKIEKLEKQVDRLKKKNKRISNNWNLLKEWLYKENKFRFEDKIMRSLGILKNAVILTSEETMSLLSDVRLGINTGIIKNISLEDVNKTMYQVLPATIVKNYNLMAAEERDLKRAELVKEYLK